MTIHAFRTSHLGFSFVALCALMAAPLSGCIMQDAEDLDGSEEPVGTAMQRTVCGLTEDFQEVESYNGADGVSRAFVDRHQAAVGQIQWKSDLASRYASPGSVNGARWCSGTLLPGNRFLTAGHCFNNSGGGWTYPKNANGVTLTSEEIATEMVVNFNYQKDSSGNVRAAQTFNISSIVERNLNGLDYAIVQLAGNPGAQFPRARVAGSDASAGDTIAIIGHPAGRPKQIDAGTVSSLSGSAIYYGDLDTLGGNSGSGIVRASDGMVVGVHTNGGCTANGGNNFGMRLSSLLAASDILDEISRIDYVDGAWKRSGGQSTTHAGNPRFRLHLDQAEAVRLDLESSVDTYLYLLDAAGNLLDSDDDDGDGYNSRLDVSLAAGDYIVVAATYSGSMAGDFQLSSSRGALSALAQGSWSSSGGRSATSAGNPRFVLNLRYDAPVVLDLTSSADSYLYLLDSAGQLIVEDDDSGGNLNSRITRQLAAGEYVLVAATYSSGQSGSFVLTSDQGTLRAAPSAFTKVTGDGAGNCPSGTYLASRGDVSANRTLAQGQLNTWDIARLTEGWALRGSGYGHDFKLETVTLGHTLCATP